MTAEPERARFDLYALERVLAFSDGVFAVAITLLVIDLRPPELPHGAGNAALLTALLGMSEKFLIYVISFCVIGALWAGHTRKFLYIAKVDGPLLWLNLMFLMAICLVPFATAVNNAFGNLTADLLYLGTLAVASALGAAVSAYGLSHPALVSPELRAGRRRDLILSPLLNTGVVLLAIAISFWSINAGRYSLFLMLPAAAYAGLRKHS
jgi:uncharacterized membrane protein